MLGMYEWCSSVAWEMIRQKSEMSKTIKQYKKKLTLCLLPDVCLDSEFCLTSILFLEFSSSLFQINISNFLIFSSSPELHVQHPV